MNQRVGITFGAFDLLHSGHCLMIADARGDCDDLYVALQSDPTIDRPDTKNKPVQSLFERWVHLGNIKGVKAIIPYQTEAEVIDILRCIRPDVRYIGEDYLGKDFTGKQLCKDLGIEIVYTARKHDFSTTQLRKRVKEAEINNEIQSRTK